MSGAQPMAVSARKPPAARHAADAGAAPGGAAKPGNAGTRSDAVLAPARDAAHAGRPAAGAKWRKALPYVIVVALAVWLYRVSDTFDASDVPGRIGPDAWPKIVLGLMIFTGCLGIVKSLLGGARPAQEVPAQAGEDAPVLNPPELYPGMVWAAIAATAIYVFLWPLLGFFLATVAYSIALMWIGRQRRYGVLLGAGAGFALFFMFLFMRIVYVSLPLGVKPFSQVSLALMSLMGIH